MFVALVETFRSGRVDFTVEEFVAGNRTAVGAGRLATSAITRHAQVLSDLERIRRRGGGRIDRVGEREWRSRKGMEVVKWDKVCGAIEMG